MPAELSVSALAAENAAVRTVEMAAHLAFTIDLELRVVGPAAGILAHRLDARAERYAVPLRRIALDEFDHAFAAMEMLRHFERPGVAECRAIDDALASVDLPPRDALVVLFLVSELVVSSYLGGATALPGDTPSLRYLREHARDEVGHGRLVGRLLGAMLDDPALLALGTGLDAPDRLAGLLGAATRAYAAASLATIGCEAAARGVATEAWPPAAAFAGLLAGGLRPAFAHDAVLATAFEAGLAAAGP